MGGNHMGSALNHTIQTVVNIGDHDCVVTVYTDYEPGKETNGSSKFFQKNIKVQSGSYISTITPICDFLQEMRTKMILQPHVPSLFGCYIRHVPSHQMSISIFPLCK